MTRDAAAFEALRPGLVRHAYRMLGDRAEAEDAVQDAYLRWSAARSTVDNDAAYLRATVTRLCLDRSRALRSRRERYAGPWLPSPLVTATSDDPAAIATLADDVSFALLLALERLSPLERAAFLLHDVMQVPFAEVATTLARSEAAVKKLASRARVRLRERPARPRTDPAHARALRDRFAAALAREDVAALSALLADDVVFTSDSDGRAPAAMVPVSGAGRVSRLLAGLARKRPSDARIAAVWLNGSAGFVVRERGVATTTIALEFEGDRIAAIYTTRNPARLEHLAETVR